MADDAPDILSQVRDKYPEYTSVPDAQLASALSDKYPEYRPYLRKYTSPIQIKAPDTQAMAQNADPGVPFVSEERPQVPDAVTARPLLPDVKVNYWGKSYPSDVAQGLYNTARGVSSPRSIGLIAGTAGLSGLPGMVAAGYFTYQQLRDMAARSPELYSAIKEGRTHDATRIATELAAEGTMAYAGGKQVVEGVRGKLAERAGIKAAATPDPSYVEPDIQPPPEAAPAPDPNQMGLFQQPEVVQTAEGPVEKNAPPAPEVTTDLNSALEARGVEPQRPQEVADHLAETYGVPSPEVSDATEPISSTVQNPDGTVGVNIEQGVDPAPKVAHEVLHSPEMEARLGPPPEGPGANDAISSATTDTLVAAPDTGAIIDTSRTGVQDWGLGQTDYVAPPQKPIPPSLKPSLATEWTRKIYPGFKMSEADRAPIGTAIGEKLRTDAFLHNNDILQEASDIANAMTPEHQAQLMDVLTGHKQNQWPALTPVINMIRTVEKGQLGLLRQYFPKLGEAANHFTMRWIEGPEGKLNNSSGPVPKYISPEGTMTNLYSKVLKGPPSENIAAGYVPESMNPFKMWASSMMDNAKLVGVAKMLKQYENAGTLARFTDPALANREWVKVESRFKDVLESDGKGSYYATPDVAQLINRWTERNPLTGGLGQQMLAGKVVTTAYELLGAMPHALSITNIAASSELAKALGDARAGRFVEALKSGGAGLSILPATLLREARANDVMRQAGLPPGERGGAMEETIQGLLDGGLKLSFTKSELAEGVKALAAALKGEQVEGTNVRVSDNMKALGELGKVLAQFPAEMSEPLFRHILKHKALHAVDTAAELIDQNAEAIASGKVTKAELYRKAVRSADAFFGMVNYRDSMMWDGVLKGALQLGVRAPGWVAGTFEGGAHAVKDAYSDLAEWTSGDEPLKMSPRTSMAMFLMLSSALTSTIVQLTSAGKAPESPKDLMYPQTGGTDYKGHPNRLSMFGYPREWASILNDPVIYAYNKRAGYIARAQEAWQGKDFYGRSLYEATDNALQRLGKGIAHQIPVPFGVTSYNEAQRRGMNDPMLSLVGMRPAPSSIDDTPAEALISKYYALRKPEAGVDETTWANRQQQRGWVQRLRVNPSDETVMADIEKAGGGTKLYANTQKLAAMDPKESMFKGLSLQEARRVYEIGSPDEKKVWAPMLRKKIDTAQKSVARGRLNYPQATADEATKALQDLDAVQ